MGRIWTGDMSTGNYSQFEIIMNKPRSWGGSGPLGPAWPVTNTYYNKIEPIEGGAGLCARFECRQGDVPIATPGGGERTEFGTVTASAANVGTTRWYAWSVKFDPDFPLIGDSTVDWTTVFQFGYLPTHQTSPVIQFGYPNHYARDHYSDYYRAGYWYLCYYPQEANPSPVIDPEAPYGGVAAGWVGSEGPYMQPAFELPLDRGQWQDLKMRIVWKQDNTGSIQLWRNGVRMTTTALHGSTDTFTGQTVAPNGALAGQEVTGTKMTGGIYRASPTTPTMVLRYANLRMSDTEGGL